MSMSTFAKFSDEKEHYRERSILDDPFGPGILPWGVVSTYPSIDESIRPLLIALNKLPFLYTASMSHSALVSEHSHLKELFSEKMTLQKILEKSFWANNDLGGYIMLRADDSDELFHKLSEQLNRIPGVTLIQRKDSKGSVIQEVNYEIQLTFHTSKEEVSSEEFDEFIQSAWKKVKEATSPSSYKLSW